MALPHAISSVISLPFPVPPHPEPRASQDALRLCLLSFSIVDKNMKAQIGARTGFCKAKARFRGRGVGRRGTLVSKPMARNPSRSLLLRSKKDAKTGRNRNL
jgi:hypothetical protein